MKRLCFGSYIKVLKQCKSALGDSQVNICNKVILSVAKEYGTGAGLKDATASDLALCKR